MTRRGAGAVFLLTDYGTVDEFAGVLRAVVTRDAPGAPVVDLTHDVPPFDVRAGALVLERTVPHLGPGVVLAVVDPGVGTERRAVAVAVRAGAGPRPSYLTGPDNGLLPWALDALGGAEAAVELDGAGEGAATFDGRDVFAPAAARLWRGEALAGLGRPLDPVTLLRLAPPRLRVGAGDVETEVLWVDRFGNVQLSARPGDLARAGLGAEGAELVVVSGARARRARRVRTFATVAPDGLGLLTDANGHLALAGARCSAAAALGVAAGDPVSLAAPGGAVR